MATTLGRSRASGKQGRFSFGARKNLAGLFFVLPSVVFITMFFAVPLVMAVWVSLHNYPLFGPHKYIGFTNYTNLAKDPQFWRSLKFTTQYAVLVTPAIFLLGFAMALLVNRPLRGVGLFRTAFFLPNVIGFGAVCLMWYFMLNNELGIINALMRQLGILQGSLIWLANYDTAMLAIIIMVVWKTAGGTMLLLLIGMQGIPDDLYEAGKVDGANAWQRMRYIMFPLLKRTFALALVLSVTGSFLAFDQFYILTNGGPQNQTISLVYMIVNTAFISFKVGYATAISIVLLFILVLLNGIQLFLLRESAQ
ncbi:MAG: sugar ABC transporter permease [Chloroflexota bacterium]|nr:sugar ABC transporter permease [Chloroflexota bacterium]PLS78085.1 MAG: sugar ABC transporter permease [Chloroflexota bacterium]